MRRTTIRKDHNHRDQSAANIHGRSRSAHCRVPECPKTSESDHGLCREHRDQIADGFPRFYLAAQNLVEDLSFASIRVLPVASFDDPFIRHCDRFLEEAIPHWLEDQDALENIEIRDRCVPTEERRGRKQRRQSIR
jgi:hypothetical protein